MIAVFHVPVVAEERREFLRVRLVGVQAGDEVTDEDLRLAGFHFAEYLADFLVEVMSLFLNDQRGMGKSAAFRTNGCNFQTPLDDAVVALFGAGGQKGRGSHPTGGGLGGGEGRGCGRCRCLEHARCPAGREGLCLPEAGQYGPSGGLRLPLRS